jgi:hypothetical protein
MLPAKYNPLTSNFPIKWSVFGEVDFETKSGKGRKIPEQIFIVQHLTADLMTQRPDFYLLPIGRYSQKKNGKNRKTKNSSPYITSFFSVHRPNKKK